MHSARSGDLSGDEIPAPGDYRTGCPEGRGYHAGVSWSSDKHMDGVSVLVDPF